MLHTCFDPKRGTVFFKCRTYWLSFHTMDDMNNLRWHFPRCRELVFKWLAELLPLKAKGIYD